MRGKYSKRKEAFSVELERRIKEDKKEDFCSGEELKTRALKILDEAERIKMETNKKK